MYDLKMENAFRDVDLVSQRLEIAEELNALREENPEDIEGRTYEIIRKHEKISPGIILGNTGNHNFLMSDELENLEVAMEAISGKALIGAGIIAVIAAIIGVLLKPSFSSGGGGGGGGGGARGSASYRTTQKEEVEKKQEEVQNKVEQTADIVNEVSPEVLKDADINKGVDQDIDEAIALAVKTIVPPDMITTNNDNQQSNTSNKNNEPKFVSKLKGLQLDQTKLNQTHSELAKRYHEIVQILVAAGKTNDPAKKAEILKNLVNYGGDRSMIGDGYFMGCFVAESVTSNVIDIGITVLEQTLVFAEAIKDIDTSNEGVGQMSKLLLQFRNNIITGSKFGEITGIQNGDLKNGEFLTAVSDMCKLTTIFCSRTNENLLTNDVIRKYNIQISTSKIVNNGFVLDAQVNFNEGIIQLMEKYSINENNVSSILSEYQQVMTDFMENKDIGDGSTTDNGVIVGHHLTAMKLILESMKNVFVARKNADKYDQMVIVHKQALDAFSEKMDALNKKLESLRNGGM